MEFDFYVDKHVKVKLTDEGLRILESRYNDNLRNFPRVTQVLGPFKAPEVDEEGYSRFQLFELMEIFGDYVKENRDVLPFEKDIIIAGEDLVEHIPNKSIKL